MGTWVLINEIWYEATGEGSRLLAEYQATLRAEHEAKSKKQPIDVGAWVDARGVTTA